MALLKADGLKMQFGGLTAVQDFFLEIKKGEIVGLIGPNGAGKTTVFNMLSGFYKPTENRIFLNGEEITGLRPDQVAGRGLARTFQNIRLLDTLKVIDNVMVGTHLHLRSSVISAIFRLPGYCREEQEMREYSMELLERLGLEQLAEEKAGNLPYGMQRKLEIARALATKPELLLLDEPVAGMNPQESQELRSFVQQIRDELGVTILLIEHDMKFVMGLCERILVMDHGQTIAQGEPDAIARNPQVIKAYLGVDINDIGN